jgi:SSS family transporter
VGFSSLDFTIVIVYFILSTGIGAWIGRKQKSTSSYFLADRNIPWPAVTFSIVATETSVLTFISIPAVAYLGNMTFLQIAFGYVIGRILVALFLIPEYFRGRVQTAYHFLGNRFGQKLRNLASVVFMGTRLLADGVRLFATAIPMAFMIKSSNLFSGMSDTQFYIISILLLGVATIFYTYVGGIRSVIWMDVVQMLIYFSGALLATVIILQKLPHGWQSVLQWTITEDKFRIIETGFNLTISEFIKKPYTFLTATVAGAVFSLASHGIDQIIIQRVLTCKDKISAQKAMVSSGVIIAEQFAVLFLIGNVLYAFYQGISPEALGHTRADGIFPGFIITEMPVGISGLIVAALFAAAMSSLSSSLSSLASTTMLDIYFPYVKKAQSEAKRLQVSRLATLIWGVLLIITAIVFIDREGTVVEIALGIASYTYGGLLGIFLLGLFFRNISEMTGIITFIVTLVVITLLIQFVQIAWPLYTLFGCIIALVGGNLLHLMTVKPK